MDGLSHVPQAGSRGALGPQKFERPVKQEAPDLSTVPHPQAGLVCAPHPGQPAGMVSSRWSAWRSVSGRRWWVPSGFPRASFEEGSWGLRGSWVLGGPLLGGMGGGEGGTQGFLPEGWSGGASWTLWWRDKETDQLPPRATTPRSSSPLGRRNGAPACGTASGAMAELGFAGRPVWISDSRPRGILGHPDGHLDRLARPGSGARLAGAPVKGRDTQVPGSVCWRGGCPTHR